MATIGTFKKDGAGFTGTIQTITFTAQVTFEPAEKKVGNARDYRLFHHEQRFMFEIGAAWKKTSKDGGEYLSVSFDDPSFAERVNCRLVKTAAELGHTLYWERQRTRD